MPKFIQAHNLQVTVKNQGNSATSDFTVAIFTGASLPSLALGESTENNNHKINNVIIN